MHDLNGKGDAEDPDHPAQRPAGGVDEGIVPGGLGPAQLLVQPVEHATQYEIEQQHAEDDHEDLDHPAPLTADGNPLFYIFYRHLRTSLLACAWE